MLIRGAAKTDIGRVRRENQDAFGFFPDLPLFLVADGVGGHAAGRTASVMAVAAIHRSVATGDADLTPAAEAGEMGSVSGRRLVIAVHHADDEVREAGRANPALRGMGTTVAALLFDLPAECVAVCHVGDSRVHRIRDGSIEVLTEDHTLVQQLYREGKLSRAELATSPHRHVLTQALGMDDAARPDLHLERVLEGDVFIMSSDGVHGPVTPNEMLAVVREHGADLEGSCTRLIDLANERGGKDNSTVIIVSCDARSPE